MSGSVTVTQNVGFGQRIKQSLNNIGGGFVLIIVALGLLYWNEGNFVETASSLDEISQKVVTVSSDDLSQAQDGDIIHFYGKAETTESLSDNVFGLTFPQGTLVAKRGVEMYQWLETSETKTQENLGGSQTDTTTYSYEKQWTDYPVDSSQFQQAESHYNPPFLFQNNDFVVSSAVVGAYQLSSDQLQQIGGFKVFPLSSGILQNLPSELQSLVNLQGDYLMIGQNKSPSSVPEIGDMRVRWMYVPSTDVSLIGEKQGNRIVNHQTDAGKQIFMIDNGIHTASAMIQSAQDTNVMKTRFLRIFGIVLVVVGWNMVFSILPTLISVVPVLGWIVGVGTGFVANVLGISMGLMVIAIAWLRYRPLVGGAVLVLVLSTLGWLWWSNRKKQAKSHHTS